MRRPVRTRLAARAPEAGARLRAYAPFSHFFMKLVLAAPDSALPSEPTALVSQLSAMHFFMNDVFAAPASALPSLPTALVSQDSCAKAEPIASVAITEARTMLLTMGLLLTIVGGEFDRRSIRRSSPFGDFRPSRSQSSNDAGLRLVLSVD